MGTSGQRDAAAETRATLRSVEVCWRAVDPSEKVIKCGIYHTDVGLDVRVGYRLASVRGVCVFRWASSFAIPRSIAARSFTSFPAV